MREKLITMNYGVKYETTEDGKHQGKEKTCAQHEENQPWRDIGLFHTQRIVSSKGERKGMR